MPSVSTTSASLKCPDIQVLDDGHRRMDWRFRSRHLAALFCEVLEVEAGVSARMALAPGGFNVSLRYDDDAMWHVVFCCVLVGEAHARRQLLEACWEAPDADA